MLQRYRPGSGKLRLIVVTDGHDTMSPEHYSGLRGMDPLMSSLHDFGYDVEWHIVVLGQVSQSERYESLAAATGGSFLAVTSFDESSRETARFLDAIADSGRSDYAHARRERLVAERTAGRGAEERRERDVNISGVIERPAARRATALKSPLLRCRKEEEHEKSPLHCL